MKKLILLLAVITSMAMFGVVTSSHGPARKSKSINCVVSEVNPYESLPPVCKSVLKVPASVSVPASLYQLLPDKNGNSYGRIIPQFTTKPDVIVNTGSLR